MRSRAVIAITLFAIAASMVTSQAFGQSIDEPIDSIRAPFSSDVTYGVVIQMETISATTGNPVLTGTAVKLPSVNLLTDDVILVDLKGNSTKATIVSGVRGTFTATPSVTAGWEQVAPYGVRKKFKVPITLAAGQTLGCRYDMPMQKFSIESMAVTTWTAILNVVNVAFGAPVQWAKITSSVAKGRIRCSPGVKAADIEPTPVPVPAPVPAPTTAPSKPGDTAPPLTQLVDATGAVFTIIPPKVFRNGADTNIEASGYNDVDYIYISTTGGLRANSPSHGYICWSGTAWGC